MQDNIKFDIIKGPDRSNNKIIIYKSGVTTASVWRLRLKLLPRFC